VTTWERRAALIREIAQLWRGDWSGHAFDGKDGCDWLTTALDGDADELAALAADLKKVADGY